MTLRSDSSPVLTYEQFTSLKAFRSFDGLRTIAVLLVILYHCPRFDLPMLYNLQLMGDLGVDLFFVISGFLITTLILREAPNRLALRLRNFYLRRALRIFPVYFLAILVFWCATYFLASQKLEVYNEFLLSLCLYYTDFKLAFEPSPFPPFGHAWSLAVEEKYYLLWPLVVIVLPERKALVVALVAILAAIVWRIALASTFCGDVTARLYYSFDGRYDAILWGSVLAFLLRNRVAWRVMSNVFTKAWVFYGSIVVYVVYGALTHNGSLPRYVIIPLLGFSILTGLLQRPTMPGSEFLNRPLICHIGKISYGIYIFHTLGVSVATRLVGYQHDCQKAIVFVAATGLSVVMCSLVYRYFELPFLRLKKHFR